MRKFLFSSWSVFCAILMMTSCKKDNDSPKTPYVPEEVRDLFGGATPTGYYSYAEMSVPAATEEVYIEYKGEDGSVRTVTQKVTPEVAVPTGGKDVEPFGTVKLLFEASTSSQVSVYYKVYGAAVKADGDDTVYTLENFPVDQITSGEFGKTRYVQVEWNFAWLNNESTGWQNAPSYPKDVVMYDAEHNHTLRYTYVYNINGYGVSPEGYVLTDSYNVEDHVAVSYKYNYCSGCGNCPYCMPWGCACGCGSVNDAFLPNGNQVDDAVDDGAVTDLPEVPEDVVPVSLPEPASYVTTDGDYTMYHSSGVVMFDDSWPQMPDDYGIRSYDYDFNDVVLDYDVEAVTVADAQLKSQGWREQVKVVLHLRAVGGDRPERVGVILEGLDQQYVASVEEYKTLDSWQNPHGELPSWTSWSLQENSFQVRTNPLRPLSEIGAIWRLRAAVEAGSETYIYTDDQGRGTEHVFNPAKTRSDGTRYWDAPREDQYSSTLLERYKSEYGIGNIQTYQFYNTVPGYVNVAGGLYTYTVIYKMKPRADMTPEESRKCLRNMMDAVVNTTAQNFYIVAKSGGNFYPIHLKGYLPADFALKGFGSGNTYKDIYDKVVAQNGGELDPANPYMSKTGKVWAFKCPVLTKHVWEKMYFGEAYPHYMEWMSSDGANCADWYRTDVDGELLTCWW